MPKSNLYYYFLALSISAAAQNAEDKAKITSSYDAKKIDQLFDNITASNTARQERITTFLVSNPSLQYRYSANGVSYLLHDIIDGKPVYRATDNANSAKAIKTNRLYPGGAAGLSLEGDGMTIGIWDGGLPLTTHQEFMNNDVSRIVTPDSPTGNFDAADHATHVSGTLIAKGVVASAKGMSPKANLRAYDWDNDNSEVLNEASNNGLLISNHSYGTPIYTSSGAANVSPWYMGSYTAEAAQWDDILYDMPYYLMVASAGNDGLTSYTGGMVDGFDKLTGNKNCKNNLVIANADPTVNVITGNLTSLIINPSSSQGPSDDGRIKPDIAADGTNLYSTYNTSTTSYTTMTGTSMASPSIAGSLTLLQQHYHNLNNAYMRSATLKAIVCTTAYDDAQIPGPDPKFGWGLLDSQASAAVISKANTSENLVLENTLANGATFTYNFSVSTDSDVKATICWTDPAGTARTGGLNNTTPALVNDLDIRVTRGTETYYPWKLQLSDFSEAIKGDNTVDNVERIDIDGASAGEYTITVSHKGNISQGPQKYSLVLTGANLVLNTEGKSQKELTVWPNPANDKVNFSLLTPIKNGSVTMYDFAGRVVYQQAVKNALDTQYSVNTSNFAKGVYILKVVDGDQSFSRKVIIK